MKDLIIEIRMWMAEKLLSWAFEASPDSEEGEDIQFTVLSYFKRKLHK